MITELQMVLALTPVLLYVKEKPADKDRMRLKLAADQIGIGTVLI